MLDTFDWNESFETGLPEVDAQHRHLVDLINSIGRGLSDHRTMGQPELEGLFAELTEYAVHHFAEEEQLMTTVGLDSRHLARHRAEHRRYVTEVTRLLDGRSPDRCDSRETMLKFLTHWLAYHILGIDQAMARQVANIRAGMTAERAFATESERREPATESLLAALHGMLGQVTERNRRVEALNESLEDRVEERTRELSALVDGLEQEKLESQRLGDELARANGHLEALAMSDVLTGLANRRHAMAQLERLWSGEPGEPLAVIVIDVDDFKVVNDTHGHDAGDEVLRVLSAELRQAARTDDTVCRMGGDELLVICPRTDLLGAEQLAHALQQRIEAIRISAPVDDGCPSISAGVAERRAEMAQVVELLRAADEALYEAKRAGRGRVRVRTGSNIRSSELPLSPDRSAGR